MKNCLHPSAFKGRIWLIGGTQESAQIASAIASARLPCTISVTTKSACRLYPPAPTLQIQVGRLTQDRIEAFLQQQQIIAILDASHPYAVEISTNAIALSQKLQIPYLRYERPVLEQNRHERRLDGFETLLSGNYLQQQRVLLTVGYRPLHLFQPWQERATLFARILPDAIALEAATESGFTPDKLICLRPPISPDLELALWQLWNISLVVTKASGTPGGEHIKRTIATQLGIPLIVIDRPSIEYPQQTSSLSAALEFCLKLPW